MANSPNLGYLFYFKYFRNQQLGSLDWKRLKSNSESSDKNLQKQVSDFFQQKNETLTKPVLDGYGAQVLDFLSENPIDGQVFYLKTTYPGLLVGSGYTHESNLLNEFKLGFYFDHTTGLPHIPGSSVKGALRAAFIDWPGLVLEIWTKMRREAFAKASQDELSSVENTWPALDLGALARLEREIFGNRTVKTEDLDDVLSMGQDIFHDAVPVLPQGERDTKLLANDYITPHINRKRPRLSPFTDPTPLQFVKVLPGVTFRFQFELTDGLISKGQKLGMFNQIIAHLGLGAKTNVGYGQFTAS